MEKNDYTLSFTIDQISKLICILLDVTGNHGTDNVFVIITHDQFIERLLFELNLEQLVNSVESCEFG